MATSNGIFGLTALTEALNAPAEESSDISSLMEELADDSIKQLVLDREVANEAEDNSKIQEFIKTIPESEDTDDVFRKADIKKGTLESLAVLTEELVLEGVI